MMQMTFRSMLWVLGLVIAAAAAPALAQEMIDNPQYQQWQPFKVGSWAKMQQTVDAQGQAMQMQVTTKLADRNDKEATLEMTMAMTVEGMTMNMPAQRIVVPAKIKKDELPKEKEEAGKVEDVKTGQEELKVGDKTIKCTWTSGTMKHQDGTFKGKWWNSPQVPGQIVKMDGKFNSQQVQGSMKSQLLDYHSAP